MFVSGHHAELDFSSGKMVIHDLSSTNNTYVNGKSVQQQTLHAGDIIYILGLQIIITGHGFFLNNPDGKVRINSTDLQEYHVQAMAGRSDEDEFEDIPIDYYYRAPRFKHDVDELEVKMDS